MGVQIVGNGGTIIGAGAEASLPMHAVIKPLHGDHFRVARRFVPAGTTVAGNLWTFRNPTGSGKVMIVKRVLLKAVQVAAPTAAIEDIFNLKVARAYTVADTTGSVSIAAAAAMQKLRTSFNNSVAELREANIAAGASGGTKTVDTDAIATGSAWVAAALGSLLGGPLVIFDYYPNVSDGEHPLALAASEGLLLANTNAFGATSGIVLHAEFYWQEGTVY